MVTEKVTLGFTEAAVIKLDEVLKEQDALEQYLIEQEGYDDWDAAVAVAYDFKLIKSRYGCNGGGCYPVRFQRI